MRPPATAGKWLPGDLKVERDVKQPCGRIALALMVLLLAACDQSGPPPGAVNSPPGASDAVVTTDEDSRVSLVLIGSDPDGDALTYEVTIPPAYGVLSGSAPVLTYDPAGRFEHLDLGESATDSLTYTVRDTSGATATGSVMLTITGNGQTLTVTSTADSGAGSLRDAIASAAAGDFITFDAGAFASPQTIPVSTTLRITDTSLTIQGPGEDLLTLSGNISDSILRVTSESVVVIADLSIQNLGAPEDDFLGAGAGIYNLGQLTLNAVTIENSLAQYGGGIYNYTSGTLTLNGATIAGNTAEGAGGGIYNAGTLNLDGGTVVANNMASSSGGGIYNGGVVNLSGSTAVTGNTAGSVGGGIYNGETLNGDTSGVTGNMPEDIWE